MKLWKFMKRNWNYIIVFLIPWILIGIHSVVRGSWLVGEGSILAGESGTVYYEFFVELWDKVHQGGSLFYTWNVGLGTDFLVQVFQYLLSPFTLLLLIVPRNGIEDMLQFIMVLRWSLAALVMAYYLMNTKHNQLTSRKRLIAAVLACCYALGNAVLQGLANVNLGDVFILFPIALLLEEKMAEGKGFKRFYICLAVMLLCNFRVAVPVLLFLLPWYFLQMEGSLQENKNRLHRVLFCYVAAILTGMLVIIPCVAATVQGTKLYAGQTAGSFAKTILISATDFIQRLYVCDTLNAAQTGQPMFYMSVVGLAVALLFFMVPVGRKQKAVIMGMLLLLMVGLSIGGGYMFWHGYIAVSSNYADISFLLSFLLIYMVMMVLQHLEQLKIWNVASVLVAGAAVFAYVFFQIEVYLNFYVYLATFLLYVLILILLIFFCRKSIKYRNMLVVFSIFCIAELLVNTYVQLGFYDMYRIKDNYYNAASEVLSLKTDAADGERIANAQIMMNYGMVMDRPTTAGQLAFTNEYVQSLFEQLGMSGTEKYYEYFGGSPLLNLMFNVRYGMSQSEYAFSDGEDKGENDGYHLYEMQRLAGLGYMADNSIRDWVPEAFSPFEAQNAFVKLAAGEDAVFTEVIPEEFVCESLFGGPRLEHELGTEEHVHEEEESLDPATVIQFDKEHHNYQYMFEKMYIDDLVVASFESDGVSDYYIYIESDVPTYSHVMINEQYLYSDQLSSKHRTIHIGIVEQGTKISVTSNADVDDLAVGTMTYQIAAFQNEVYDKVYEKLSQNSYSINEYTDVRVSGMIQADEDGIMLTSIPAVSGWRAYVDGQESSYETVGGALIGVPLEQGEHEIEFRYTTPDLAISGILAVIGILLFAGYCVWDKKYNQVAEE